MEAVEGHNTESGDFIKNYIKEDTLMYRLSYCLSHLENDWQKDLDNCDWEPWVDHNDETGQYIPATGTLTRPNATMLKYLLVIFKCICMLVMPTYPLPLIGRSEGRVCVHCVKHARTLPFA